MEHLAYFNFTNFLIAFLGATIHVGINIYNAVKNSESGFSLAVMLTDPLNYLRLLLTVLAIVALLFAVDPISKATGFNPAIILLYFGWSNFSIIERLMKLTEKSFFNKKK